MIFPTKVKSKIMYFKNFVEIIVGKHYTFWFPSSAGGIYYGCQIISTDFIDPLIHNKFRSFIRTIQEVIKIY